MFGKPSSIDEAIKILEYLSGKTHIVQTSVCVYYEGKFTLLREQSRVTFKSLDENQKENIRKYVLKAMPFDKSGSYGIQDEGNFLIHDFEGDLFNIIGLPVSSLYRLIRKLTKNGIHSMK